MTMKNLKHLALALGLAGALLAPAQAQTADDGGLKIISDLALVNGQALACQELQVASRAKNLMIAHAPKTARFGNAYETGTQQSYAAQIGGSADCPSSAALTAKLDMLAQQLKISLPATTPGAASTTPTGTQ
jgi:hypothetical protein